jgi:hypothetical protein
MSQNSPRDDRIAVDRRTLLKTLPLAGLVGVGATPVSARARCDRFPDHIPLPTGFQPEGIVSGRGSEFFVGSLGNGDIFRGDYRTGEGEVLSTEGEPAVGLSYDQRSDHLFVAGGGTGKAFVYDARTGETDATYQFTDPQSATPGSFVNDVVVTREAAYFTDSFRVSDAGRAFLYRVPLGPGGRLPEQDAVSYPRLKSWACQWTPLLPSRGRRRRNRRSGSVSLTLAHTDNVRLHSKTSAPSGVA